MRGFVLAGEGWGVDKADEGGGEAGGEAGGVGEEEEGVAGGEVYEVVWDYDMRDDGGCGREV